MSRFLQSVCFYVKASLFAEEEAAAVTLSDTCYLLTCAVCWKSCILQPGQRTTRSSKRELVSLSLAHSHPPVFLSVITVLLSPFLLSLCLSLSLSDPSCCCTEQMPGGLWWWREEHWPLNHHATSPLKQRKGWGDGGEKEEVLSSTLNKYNCKILHTNRVEISSFP